MPGVAEDQEGGEDEGRLDQQMGDTGDAAEEVDARMWDEEDKEAGADGKPDDSAYEKDAPVSVDDKKDLEYAAGQEEEEPREPEGGAQKDKGGQPQPQPEDAPEEEQGEGEEAGEYEDR